MQTQYTIVHKGKTLFYTNIVEAEKMAKFIGFPVANIKIVDLF